MCLLKIKQVQCSHKQSKSFVTLHMSLCDKKDPKNHLGLLESNFKSLSTTLGIYFIMTQMVLKIRQIGATLDGKGFSQ